MAGPGGAGRRIAGECVSVRLRLINRVISAIYDRALQGHGLRVSQMNILAAVAALGPVPRSDLAARLCLERSTLTRDLARLVDRGWIEEIPTAGRSRGALRLSADGEALLERVGPDWEAAQREAMARLGPGMAGAIKGLGDSWMHHGPGRDGPGDL